MCGSPLGLWTKQSNMGLPCPTLKGRGGARGEREKEFLRKKKSVAIKRD